jgi:hypothetical protein
MSATQEEPLAISLQSSASTLSLSGEPPYTVTISYICKTIRPIYALISLYTEHASGIIVRDPNHWKAPNRPIGCISTVQCDYDPVPEHEDAVFVRLGPEGTFESTFTIGPKPRWGTRGVADTHRMKVDGKYWVDSRTRKYWWLYEDEIEESLTEEEKRKVIVERGNVVEVKPDCRLDFTAVA